MIKLAKEDGFAVSKEIFCGFNELAAKGEALVAGAFRTSGVAIGGTEWKPPPAEKLDHIFNQGVEELAKLQNPLEKGIAFFLFGARNQFFFDGNKRSSRLMMNSILLNAGQDIITVPAKKRQDFNAKMVDFYTQGDATSMMEFLGSLQIKSRFES